VGEFGQREGREGQHGKNRFFENFACESVVLAKRIGERKFAVSNTVLEILRKSSFLEL
jgi:hypothetical protein